MSGVLPGYMRSSVSGLIGIHPPLSTMTSRLSANPIPSIQNPGCLRFSHTKTRSRSWDAASAIGMRLSGTRIRAAGEKKASHCGRNATGTNQTADSAGIDRASPLMRARSKPAGRPMAIANSKTIYRPCPGSAAGAPALSMKRIRERSSQSSRTVRASNRPASRDTFRIPFFILISP